jgi:hypothetical protein
MSNGRRGLSTQAGAAVARVTKPVAPRRQELIVALTRLADEIDAWLDGMGASRRAPSGHPRGAPGASSASNRPVSALRTRK